MAGQGEATSRFSALVSSERLRSSLGEAAMLVAAHAYEGLDVGAEVARLDDLAARCPARDLDALLDFLFVAEGFAGNDADYYDPRNSYLNDVLDRRTGIPITLSVVLMEVGRRLGLRLHGVGAAGHFLVAAATPDGPVLVDAFHRGRRGPATGLGGPELPLVDAGAIVARMLANLRQIHLRRGDQRALEWVLRLIAALPDAGLEVRTEHAAVLVAVGRFDAAADVLLEAASELGEPRGPRLAARAQRIRARLN